MKYITQFQLDKINKYRQLANYKVVDSPLVQNNDCLVCFSSNGLYFPNTNERLDAVIKQDKYEWESIIHKKYKRIIYLRDIYKQWYVKGINEEFDSIIKVKELLSELTAGYKCTFIGSSAGGYAATLFGELLNADKVFNFAGQFDIRLASTCRDKNLLVHATEDKQYFNISKTKKQNFYIYPTLSPVDQEQYNLIKNNPNVKVIKVESAIHGVPILPFAINKLIKLNDKAIIKLTKKSHNKILLSLLYASLGDFVNYFTIKLKKQKKLIHNFFR